MYVYTYTCDKQFVIKCCKHAMVCMYIHVCDKQFVIKGCKHAMVCMYVHVTNSFFIKKHFGLTLGVSASGFSTARTLISASAVPHRGIVKDVCKRGQDKHFEIKL